MDDLTLYAKAAPDGVSLGDCPFTQKAHLALRFNGLDFTLRTIDLDAKPDWFLAINPAGSVPVLTHGTRMIADSDEIAAYVGTLPGARGAPTGPETARDLTGALFSSFFAWVQNRDAAAEPAAKQAYAEVLARIDTALRAGVGPYLGGAAPNLDDVTLGPRLYHTETAARRYKAFATPETLTAVGAFRAALHATPEWQATCYPAAMIEASWARWA